MAEQVSSHLSASRTSVYYVRHDGLLYALPFAGGPERRIGSIMPGGSTVEKWIRFTVSPDDSHIIWGMSYSAEMDLEMVTGFR